MIDMRNLLIKIVAILWGSSKQVMAYSAWVNIYSESRKKNLLRLNDLNERLGLGGDFIKKNTYGVYGIYIVLVRKAKLLCLFFFCFAKRKIPNSKLLILMEWGRYGQIETVKQLKDFLLVINHPLCNTDIYLNSNIAIFDPVQSTKANKNSEVEIFDLGDIFASFGLKDKLSIIGVFFSLLLICKDLSIACIFRSAMAIVTAKFIAKQTVPSTVIMTTSNSYMTEGLRFELLCNSSAVNVVEILHGIPTLEIDEYHQKLSKILGEVPHSFIPKLNAVNLDPVYKCQNVPAINLTTLTRNSSFQKNKEFIYIGLGGGTAYCENYLESKIFQLELNFFKVVDDWARINELAVVKLYTLHPYRRIKKNIDYLLTKHPDVMLLNDSLNMWEAADIFLTVYSSSIWEAEQYGAKVWFPVKASDNLFSDLLLGERGMAETENDVAESLMNFLDKFKKEVM
jgi:hypothetical protein